MFHTDRAILVEGRYDKARLSSLTDALIVTTEGFGVFSDHVWASITPVILTENG